MKPTICPYCEKKDTLVCDEVRAHVERGVYDGETYEDEGECDVYRCLECDRTFLDYQAESLMRTDDTFPHR